MCSAISTAGFHGNAFICALSKRCVRHGSVGHIHDDLDQIVTALGQIAKAFGKCIE